MIANDDDKGTKATLLCLVLSFVCYLATNYKLKYWLNVII